MNAIKQLKPLELWGAFHNILTIPRPSHKEEMIRDYLISFAADHHLDHEVDQTGNLIIRKSATPGYGNRQSTILQSHLDMVCEKNSDVTHDFLVDPINAYIDGNWIRAKGTTLGADDGIGIAAQMAILSSNSLEHGPIECLFTVAEETGLIGAFGLEPGFLRGKILINLDSEDEGEIFIGCAGGTDTTALFDFKKEPVPGDHHAIRLSVKGLQGGHSGDDIHKGLGNANKILVRFLSNYMGEFRLRLHCISGGNLRNAIAREASAVITLPQDKKEDLVHAFAKFHREILKEFKSTEPKVELFTASVDTPDYVIDENAQFNLIHALYACPHGVHSWSQSLSGLVETSTNLAAIKGKEGQIEVMTSQRSSLESGKQDIRGMVTSVFLLAGAKVHHSTGYPGWNPNQGSEILQITEDAYYELFGTKPVVRAIHAGLECGLFLIKYPDLNMVSFGPTIKGAHSPDERLDIESTTKFWKLLLEVLKRIPSNE